MPISIFIDTCAVLDLVRAPVREEFHLSYATGTRKLLEALRSPSPPARVICVDLVEEEYRRNVDEVTAETLRLLRQVRDKYQQAVSIVSALGAAPCPEWTDDKWILEAVQVARRSADHLLQIATKESVTAEDKQRALRRVLSATPPSRRGKDSTADCIILEATLRLARSNSVGRTVPHFFFSSNTQEYCEDKKLKASLESEFADCGIDFVRNWGEASWQIFRD
jgi:hypothetical protein